MADVLIPDLDEALIEAYRARAFAKGITLEQELHDVIVRAAQPTREELLEEMRRIRAMTPTTHVTLAEDEIRHMRDSR